MEDVLYVKNAVERALEDNDTASLEDKLDVALRYLAVLQSKLEIDSLILSLQANKDVMASKLGKGEDKRAPYARIDRNGKFARLDKDR